MIAWFHRLLARMFGWTPQPDTQVAMACLHPAKALTACTYQLGPKGKYGWFYRCRRCLAWFPC